ncbi:MAG: hypothetical protein CM1200mP40_34000 [Gammaproteobacteria bacterium]|nr:MAG: hypothetical protein CM1200mP40_34000 [Gammaproteobacteria bacterium]
MANGKKRPFSGAPFNMGSTLQAVCGKFGKTRKIFFCVRKTTLSNRSIQFFPHHYNFTIEDFLNAGIDEKQPIVMTEKDAIKCKTFAKKKLLGLQVELNLPDFFLNEFTKKVKGFINLSDQEI